MKTLKNAWNRLKNEDKPFIFIVLVLITIPLYNPVFNSVCIFLFLLSSMVYLKKNTFCLKKILLLPIGLYLIMVLSCFWTIDSQKTIPALFKEIPLLIIPICFMFIGSITPERREQIMRFYSCGLLVFCVFYLLNAVFKYISTSNLNVFFYHELVTKDVNAIHVSVYMTMAFFYFFTKTAKTFFDYTALSLLALIIFLLSSKNIIIICIVLIMIYHLYYSKISNQLRLKNLMLFGFTILLLFSLNIIKNKFEVEMKANSNRSISANVIENVPKVVHIVSISEAWQNAAFTANDYFPGTAFRVYQFRIFLELMQENSVFWTGFGLNASYKKIDEKGNQYNVYKGVGNQDGYQKKNFHNQYVQNFADLGFLGFLILLVMLTINLKNALKNRDFVHITFAVIMISLFLTESFLWRQRGVVFFTILFCVFNNGIKKLEKIV